MDNTPLTGVNTATWNDIWDADVLKQFKGPDGRPFFKQDCDEPEGCYAFSLFMDGFNPLQTKEAGKKVSVASMYMVCLNLPPCLRYRVENMFLVGVIPGPQEPSQDEINFLLKPLVDDLLRFWNPGVCYSCTPKHPKGRRTRCVVIPLVCDVPAARQMAGLSHHSHTLFCSVCLLDGNSINNLDFSQWKYRTDEEHRRFAEQWRDAATQEDRQAIYDTHGVRWSELLRLPYWEPTNFVVVDVMHALFLGNFKRHCRTIWGMDICFADGDGSRADESNDNALPTAEIVQAHLALRGADKPEFWKTNCKIMHQLCRDMQLPLPKKPVKKELGKLLDEYVCFPPLQQARVTAQS